MTVIRLISYAEQFKHKENLYKVTATHTHGRMNTRRACNKFYLGVLLHNNGGYCEQNNDSKNISEGRKMSSHAKYNLG